MSDQPVIVQFMHPGNECRVANGNPKGPVSVPWVGASSCGKCGGHTRRFVSHKGAYVDDGGRLRTAKLGFWTEWEAASVAVGLPPPVDADDARLFARWVHTVESPLRGRPGRQNTDPCVFGKSFKYCCCQQSDKGVMRRLAPGSLVLFGSHLAGRFVLDTVFVTQGPGIPYGNRRTDGIVVSQAYRALSLERVWDGQFSFYRGRAFAASAGDAPYSFTPSRMFEAGNPESGRRFVLDIEKVNQKLATTSRKLAPGLRQRFKKIDADADAVFAVWKEILRQVRVAGFVPGVHFDWPVNK